MRLILSLLVLASLASSAREPVDLEKYRGASTARWEKDIAKLEALDRAESHPDDAILFVGSSSVRLWKTIADDMAPYHPIQRGFGGSKWSDVAVFADRLITPHKFRAVVFFVANDISGGRDDKTPEEVAALFAHVWERVRIHAPDAPVFFIPVTPTPSRWAVWPAAKQANSAIRAFCSGQENTWFIGTESIYLDTNGQPRHDLFVDDKLHLNAGGYRLWAAAIKSHLDTVLNGAG